MDTVLPDVSTTEHSPSLSALEWVGMQGIDLPIMLAESGYRHALHARADAQVDLPARHVKGIHMSRLYRELDHLADPHDLTPHVLRAGSRPPCVAAFRTCEPMSATWKACIRTTPSRGPASRATSRNDLGASSLPAAADSSARDGLTQ
ncbi:MULTISPECIES: GTP cyclohydrolase, FolE2/MptA family [Achromobacter]|uniref:GTP cyclohydrolase, FolE2/MptA family n=1 Tax=Achromobacter TaxID=222 RepID=UPI0035E434C1